ncbi:MAG: sensor histidine kinase N-terminal domain-containing protein [Fulvimonas sp.]|jgi:two-component system sensor histidine kinase TctE|nr:sensor histidine kinase N-terminal domain-containing protein [Fulvimonas sp.]
MSSPAPRQPPSLRRRLLLFLLVPMLVFLLLDAVITYAGALAYSNRVHDKDLADDVLTLAQMIRRYGLRSDLPPQARFLIEYDPDGHNRFSIVSRKRGLISGGERLFDVEPPVGAPPVLYDASAAHHPLRVAAYSMPAPDDPDDVITISIGETLQSRHRNARDILLLTIPMQSLLIACVLLLVWFGVDHGLKVLNPLVGRLRRREHELEPITAEDVPIEILPLTRTIDLLFARLKRAMQAQERFLADAAHQLRTPLAGFRLHAERALANPADTKDALHHILRLTERTTRIANQLLAISRAQSRLANGSELPLLDLAAQVPGMVALRVPEALHAGLDLGYQGPDKPLHIQGHADALQELLDNLIDNAMRYAGPGRSATVRLGPCPDGGAELVVEDDGPGVPEALMPRLGERFFRVPGHGGPGTGLGLAIVQQIAQLHGAQVTFGHSEAGGFKVTVRFPPPAAATSP